MRSTLDEGSAGTTASAHRVVGFTGARAALQLRPIAILRTALSLIVVANLGRIPVLSTGDREAPLLFNDFCVAAIAVAGALIVLQRRRLVFDLTALAAMTFAAIGGMSAVSAMPRFGLTPFELMISLAYLARWMFYMSLYLAVINIVRRRDVSSVFAALDNALLIFAGFGIFQAIFLPGFAQMVYPDSRLYTDWDPQGHRLVSTMLEPNIAAALLLVGLFIHIGRIAAGVRVQWWKPTLLFLACVLTLSRSAALALVVGGFVILLIRGLSKRILRVVIAVLLLCAASLPQLIHFAANYDKFSLGGSAALRVVAWLRAAKVVHDHPIIGVGFNTYGFVQERAGFLRLGAASYSTDGGLLFIAAMTGMIGVTVYGVMLWSVWRRCRAIWRDDSYTAEEHGIAIGTGALTVALCVHSLFVNSLLTTFIMEPLWLVWGLTLSIRRGGATSHVAARRVDDSKTSRPVLVAVGTSRG